MAEDPHPGEGPEDARERDARALLPAARRPPRTPGEALEPDLVPPPPPATARRSRPLVATLSSVLSFVGIAAVVLVVAVSFGVQRIGAPGPLAADKVVVILPGTDVGEILDQLQQEGVIDSAALMSATLFAEGERGRIKAGEYMFKQNASLRDVIDTLVSGKQVLHSVTIPEGLTSEQICDRLRAEDILTGDIKAVPKEGTLMPNTYKFSRGTTREQILRNMAMEQKRVVTDVWSHRAPDTPIKSPYEMLTLASIVEKETGKADERPRVAGVFINRLNRNIPLQSDPTTVYGLYGGKGAPGHALLRSELDQRTPYNTYTISGLPPGPICNPGRAAMEAVANPSRTRDIYFVADGTGGHAFAETLDQHRQNVARWRQIEKDAKDKFVPEVDKAPPGGAGSPLPRNQRGEIAPMVPVFGALTGRFETAPAATMVGLAAPPLSLLPGGETASKFAPLADDPTTTLDPDRAPPADAVAGDGAASGSAEERALASADPGLSFPVPGAQRADERARAAQFGVPQGPGPLPVDAEVASAGPSRPPAGKGRVTDASEGTKLDPLLDKTYDLNSAKTVPSFTVAAAPRAVAGKR